MTAEKKSKVFPVHNRADIERVTSALNKLQPGPDKTYFVRVSLQGEGRRDKQNRLSFMWYKELGDQSGNGKEYERNYCKYTFGCTVLMADETGNSDQFIEFYGKLIDTLEYEQLINAMEFVEVTSHMNVKQFAEYLTDIDHYAVQQGWQLTHPDDLYYEALMQQHG